MTKRKNVRKPNKILNPNINYYSWGGDFSKAFSNAAGSLKTSFSGANIGKALASGISDIGGVLGKGAHSLISNGLSSGAGNAISNAGGVIGGALGKVNPLLGGVVSLGTGIIGGGINKLFGSKLNQETINDIKSSNNSLNNLVLDTSSVDNMLGNWSTMDFGKDFTKSDIGKDGVFSNKAKNTYKLLTKQQNAARDHAYNTFATGFQTADTASDLDMLSKFYALGGPLTGINGALDYDWINENLNTNRMEILGKNRITSMPNSFTSLKTFAKGGDLHTNGTDFTNGLTIINNGGMHEENPMEGVPMGVDNEGTPNLVEEGEVVWNDYVFSNRIPVPEAIREKYKLRGAKDLTFADAAKKLSKESEERPNDPISKRGLDAAMSRLQVAQETLRQNMMQEEYGKFAKGGKKVNKFSGFGTNIMSLEDPVYAGDFWKKYMNIDEESPYKPSKLTWLRYAPVLGATIGLGQTLFSKPDYSSANAVLEAANSVGNYTPITYNPIGNYLQYRPLDRNYYINSLNAQAGATRNAIMNSISPSRNASLLAADYNAQTKVGELARQAEEYNAAQRQAIGEFNRQTDMTNAEMGLKAAMANQDAALRARSGKLSGIAQAMALRDAVDERRAKSLSANLTNLFNNLGNIGIDAYNRNDRNMLLNADVYGTLSQKPQDFTDKEWEDYKKLHTKAMSSARNNEENN